jgi:hypothetical protein
VRLVGRGEAELGLALVEAALLAIVTGAGTAFVERASAFVGGRFDTHSIKLHRPMAGLDFTVITASLPAD